MSANNPEQEPQSNLADQVMVACREAYDTLRALSEGIPYELNEDDNPESLELSREIGSFVAVHSVALGNITEIPRTPELQTAVSVWLEARLRRKLRQAMYDEVFQLTAGAISKILRGRIVQATSLRLGYGVSDDHTTTSGPDSPLSVKAPFLTVNPALGQLLLGRQEKFYTVNLFDHGNPTSPTEAASVIEVL